MLVIGVQKISNDYSPLVYLVLGFQKKDKVFMPKIDTNPKRYAKISIILHKNDPGIQSE